jgi:hypothetical protein
MLINKIKFVLSQRNDMKSKSPTRLVRFGLMFKITIILILSIFLIGADTLYRDQIPGSGSDLSSIRCSGKIVRTGDLIRDVEDKCGEPTRSTYMPQDRYEVWIYRFGQSNYLHYFAFLHRRLQRIYKVSCRGDNPDCE